MQNNLILLSFLTSLNLMAFLIIGRYPSLRVAYIDEVEEPVKDKSKKGNQKVYYSVLVKVPKSTDHSSPAQNLDQVMQSSLKCVSNYRFVQSVISIICIYSSLLYLC